MCAHPTQPPGLIQPQLQLIAQQARGPAAVTHNWRLDTKVLLPPAVVSHTYTRLLLLLLLLLLLQLTSTMMPPRLVPTTSPSTATSSSRHCRRRCQATCAPPHRHRDVREAGTTLKPAAHNSQLQ